MMGFKRTKRIDLNPSSADRWTTCTASPKFIFDNWDRLPPSDNQFSQEGTSAHEVAAAYLQNREPNPAACPVPVDAAMRWHGWNYMEYVESLREPGSKLLVEQKLPLFYAESRNAIVDAAVINPGSLHVVDYKYGEGIIVSPEQNLQATIYAKSVVWASSRWNTNERGFSEAFTPADEFPVFVHIYQPRTRDAGPISTWQTSWGEISRIARTIFEQATNILLAADPRNPKADNLVFKPSEKACQWCPAKGFCTARQAELLEGIEPLSNLTPAPVHLVPVKAVSVRQLVAIVKNGKAIKKWIEDAEAYALQYMSAGHELPGLKLVQSRGGNRYWTNPTQAAKLLHETTVLRENEIWERKVIGPAAAEKLLGKDKFAVELVNLIGKPPGQPVIAPEDDPRPSCHIDAQSEFAPLDGAPASVEDF